MPTAAVLIPAITTTVTDQPRGAVRLRGDGARLELEGEVLGGIVTDAVSRLIDCAIGVASGAPRARHRFRSWCRHLRTGRAVR